jgi:predicted CoA-binding protein
MASLDQIRAFLSAKRLAVAGVSRNPKDFSRLLFREFLRRGYDAVPVHPDAGEIDGCACFARLQDVAPPVEAVLLMTPPAATEQVVRDCAEAGVKQVWMYRAAGAGAVSRPAVDYCESRGIDVIEGECPLMFFENTGFLHRLHGFIRKITGRYPQVSARRSCQAAH